MSIEFGANYSERRLRDYRQFYLSFDDLPNWHSRVPNLTWTHFRRIMAVPHPDARRWYAEKASREMWSIRTLDRNIGTQYYGRLCAAKREGEQLPKAENIHVDDPKEYIKNPMVAFIISLMKFEFQSDFCNFVENSVDMGKDKITTDSGKQIEATAPVIIPPAALRIYLPFMPNGSLTAWLKGIVYGIIRSTGSRCMSLSGIVK